MIGEQSVGETKFPNKLDHSLYGFYGAVIPGS